MILIQDAQKNPLLFDEFIKENFGLVYAQTRKYRNADEYEDYFQLGCMGLVKAAKRFKPDFETKFSTYAVPMIIGEIKRYRRDNNANAGLKISRSVKELARKIHYLRGKSFTDEEICQELGIAIDDITESDKSCQFTSSLNEPVGINDHGGVRTLEETLPSDANVEINVIEDIEVREKLKILKGMLSNDYYKAFALYLAGKSQEEIAGDIGVSQVQVSRIQRKIKELCDQINSDYEIGKKTITCKAKHIGNAQKARWKNDNDRGSSKRFCAI